MVERSSGRDSRAKSSLLHTNSAEEDGLIQDSKESLNDALKGLLAENEKLDDPKDKVRAKNAKRKALR